MKIIVDDVTKIIKKACVVDHVSMELNSGEIVGLQGVNGSGKTMLMRLIAGLIFPSSGTITIGGKQLGKDMTFPEDMGILIENPAFLDSYSGFANLKFLASIRDRISDEEIRRTLERVGLEPDSRKKYRKYSLGMKQRLGIAGAILEAPELLILDEPTNALDTDGVELFRGILLEEKKRGALIVISCHDTAMLREFSDRIFHMESGRIVEEERV